MITEITLRITPGPTLTSSDFSQIDEVCSSTGQEPSAFVADAIKEAIERRKRLARAASKRSRKGVTA